MGQNESTGILLQLIFKYSLVRTEKLPNKMFFPFFGKLKIAFSRFRKGISINKQITKEAMKVKVRTAR